MLNFRSNGQIFPFSGAKKGNNLWSTSRVSTISGGGLDNCRSSPPYCRDDNHTFASLIRKRTLALLDLSLRCHSMYMPSVVLSALQKLSRNVNEGNLPLESPSLQQIRVPFYRYAERKSFLVYSQVEVDSVIEIVLYNINRQLIPGKGLGLHYRRGNRPYVRKYVECNPPSRLPISYL
jgi:hypothetical protein